MYTVASSLHQEQTRAKLAPSKAPSKEEGYDRDQYCTVNILLLNSLKTYQFILNQNLNRFGNTSSQKYLVGILVTKGERFIHRVGK